MTIDLNKMLDKRREVLGEGNKFDVKIGEKTFWLVAPELASSEFNDHVENLRTDANEGYLSGVQMKNEIISAFLEDQADDFAAAADAEGVDPFIFLNWALDEHNEQVRRNPTRTPSRSTPKRAKRR